MVVSNEHKHPIFLPREDYVTGLIIRKAHKNTLHGSTRHSESISNHRKNSTQRPITYSRSADRPTAKLFHSSSCSTAFAICEFGSDIIQQPEQILMGSLFFHVIRLILFIKAHTRISKKLVWGGEFTT